MPWAPCSNLYFFLQHIQQAFMCFNKLISRKKILQCRLLEQHQLTLKQLRGRGRGGGVNFSKSMSPKQRVKPCFFVTFDIIISHVFPENFI